MTTNHVDIVVIGAGATGANIAYEACKRGMKVALIDEGDIGGATSCRSTKLLHGGVRYLELAFKSLDISQLKLVREALLERFHWLNEAPFLAHPIELTLPTRNCVEKAYYKIGLGLYDTLSGKKSIGSSRIISSSDLTESLPLIRQDLNGGVAYKDGQFDDARLNLLIALTAEKAGSIIRTYCKVIGLEKNNLGHLTGVITENYIGQNTRWNAKWIVNATGTNADNVRKMADPNVESRLLISRGTHIVLKNKLCNQGVGMIIPSTIDGRVLFILPFFNHTLIGTTDIQCNQGDELASSQKEKEYLINHLKEWFPSLKNPYISSVWSGGRPLIQSKEQIINSSKIVREHEIERLPCGLISALGGKWTTCRSIALDTFKKIEEDIGKEIPIQNKLPLIGTKGNKHLTEGLLEKQKKELSEHLPKTELLEKQVDHLQSKFGLTALEIVQRNSQDKLTPLSEVMPICEAEIKESIKNEHACTPTDVLARRCRLAMVDIKEAQRLTPIVNDYLSESSLPTKQTKINL